MALNSQAPDLDKIRRDVLLAVQEIQNNRARLLGDQALARLALAPYWPLEVAMGGLALSGDVDETLETAVRGRLLETGPGPSPWKEPIFWMVRPARDSALQRLATSRKPEFFRQQLVESGKAMASMGGSKLAADPYLFRWAQLATAAVSDESFDSFIVARVDAALRESTSTGQLASPEALRWIEAAEPLGEFFGGGFEAGVAAAKRRYELFHRHAHDSRHLQNYFLRREQDQAFFDLLNDDEHWALHFIGQGGTGKTMLLRHITIHLAASAEAAVSRVDFDYLNPEYPERNPGLLLMALAEEFRLQAGPDAERAFNRFQEVCNHIYRQVEGAFRQGQTKRLSPKGGEFRRALELFAEALSSTRQWRHPVLILDTCEELAKLQPTGQVPRNVADTFEILEELHHLLKDIRVVFSGRRPLPGKPYLGVHPIRGFTHDEAQQFLTSYRSPDERAVRPELIPEILKLAQSSEGAEPRHNPYDLDTYATWAAADPALTAEALAAAGPHLFVKERIVDRLTPFLRGILPSLTLLGRFDRDLLEALPNPNDSLSKNLIEVLAQEWIQPDIAGATETWRIDPLLRERLLRYYREQDRPAYHSARARLAELLPEGTRTRPFANLTPQVFAACLDVLLDNPSKAADWWEEIEARIAGEAQWEWAAELMKYIDPETQAADGERKSLTAALLATSAAIMLHSGGGDRRSMWEGVLDAVGSHPTAAGQRRLRLRAWCALQTSFPAEFLPHAGSAQDTASALAALEGLVEAVEAGAQGDVEVMARHLQPFLPSGTAPDLDAFEHLLRARQMVLSGRSDQALAAFETALRIWYNEPSDTRQVWLDWIRPANLEHRILLELARLLPDQFLHRASALAERIFDSPLRTIDSDRLASAWLLVGQEQQALWKNPFRDALLKLYQSSLGLIPELPRCRAHYEFPPFFVALLEGRAMSGEVEEALTELRKLSQTDLNRPDDVTLAIDAAVTRIIRRMRLISEGLQIPKTVLNSPEQEYVELAAFTQALHRPSARPEDVPRERAPKRRVPALAELERAEVAYLKRDPETPEKAEQAFRHALDRSDDLSCLQALLIKAMWSAREGDHQQAMKLAHEARPYYAGLAERNSRLPRWEELVQAAQNGSAANLLGAMGPKPAVWRPWITRLLACMSAPPREDLAKWLLANDVAMVDGKAYVAPELEFVTVGSQAEAGGAPDRTSAQSKTSRLLRGSAGVLLGALGLALASAMLWAVYRFLYGAALDYFGIPISQPWRVLLFVACLVVISQLPKLFELLFAVYARVIRVESIVVYDSPPADVNRPLASPGVRRTRIRVFTLAVFDWRDSALPASLEERYALVFRDVYPNTRPSKVASLIFRLLRSSMIDVKLTVDDWSAAAPWEAMIGTKAGLRNSPFIVRRVTREQRVGTQPEWRAPVEVLTWGDAPLLQSGERWGGNFRDTFARNSQEFERVRPEVGALRILGNPVDSTSGLVIRLGGYDPTAGGSYSVRPADLITRYPAVRLCIVQCPPTQARQRLPSDRRDAALLKRIGAEVFASGVLAVLIVPVLSAEASAELIGGINKVLAGAPSNAVLRLERAIKTFRQNSLSKVEGSISDAEEVAADVCLYARDGVSFKLRA